MLCCANQCRVPFAAVAPDTSKQALKVLLHQYGWVIILEVQGSRVILQQRRNRGCLSTDSEPQIAFY